MASVKWAAGTLTSLLTTQLNSLASGSLTALGAEFDNTSGLYLFGDFQLDVTFASAPTVNTPVTLYLVPEPDGSNYNFGGSSAAWAGFIVGGWQMMNINTQQLLTIRGIPLPPTKFKIQVLNATNQAMPSSGTTVKMLPYYYQIV